MAIDGRGSVWPVAIDAWPEFENGVCQKVTAADFNKIQHAVFMLERQSINVLLHGHPTSILQPTVSGDARPKILFKTYTVAITGSSAPIKTLQISGFTAAEKAIFGGTPLASGNTAHVHIRRVPGNSNQNVSHHVGFKGPDHDPTGDSGIWLQVTRLDPSNDIEPGTYVVSLMITRG